MFPGIGLLEEIAAAVTDKCSSGASRDVFNHQQTTAL
jgi:hypothetical protein